MLREAKKRKERSKRNLALEQKEQNFCPYVNGPNKHIGINKGIHETKANKQFCEIGKERKKWQSPAPHMPPIFSSKKQKGPVKKGHLLLA